jgi:soluble lytic murein transglycosylase-like protein
MSSAPPSRRRSGSRLSRRFAALVLGLALATAVDAGPGQGQAPDPALRMALAEAAGTSSSFHDRFQAEVWLLDMSNRLQPFMPDTQERLSFLRAVHRESARARLPPELVLSVIDVESRFDRFAVSRAGAQGYMQVMKFWVGEIGRPQDNLIQRDTNLRYGCTILRYYLDVENNDLVRALARYNGSLGKPGYPRLVLNALSRRWYRS